MLADEATRLISHCDPSIFTVGSQTTMGDRASLLRVHSAVAGRLATYRYLEVGSFIGGTLVPHLLDARCTSAVSIDVRPDAQVDERARKFYYDGVSTETMLDHLRPSVSLASLAKLHTIDADASQVSPADIGAPVDLALIDGEHTNVAAFSDFISIFPSLAPDAVVLFHDANLIFDAIRNIECFLRYRAISHRTFILPDVVGVIALRSSQASMIEQIGPYAADRMAFGRTAKQQLHEMIAQSVAEGAHLHLG